MKGPEGDGRLLGAVLAGGRSRRYGSPKALAPVGGRPMVARAVGALQGAGVPVVVVGGNARVREAAGAGVRAFISDRMAGKGPLGGLHAALAQARQDGYPGVFLLACDLPLVTAGLVSLLAAHFDGTGIVLPEGAREPEPLVGCYPVGCLPLVERRLRAHGPRLGMRELVRTAGCRALPASLLAAAGDPRDLLLNVNTPEDRARAQERLVPEG